MLSLFGQHSFHSNDGSMFTTILRSVIVGNFASIYPVDVNFPLHQIVQEERTACDFDKYNEAFYNQHQFNFIFARDYKFNCSDNFHGGEIGDGEFYYFACAAFQYVTL